MDPWLTLLGPHEVHVWRAPLGELAGALDQFQALLSADEEVRRGRFIQERDRCRFALARGILRTLLSGYVGVPARDLVFHYPTSAKPALPGSDLQFSLSHTDGMAVYALTLGRRIGIDVERVRAVQDRDALARRNFAAEEVQAYEALPPADRPSGFFRIWTRKEAYVKALGEGLGHDLTAFAVSHDLPARLLRTRAGDAAAWSLWDLTDDPAWVTALAVHGTGLQVRTRNFGIIDCV